MTTDSPFAGIGDPPADLDLLAEVLKSDSLRDDERQAFSDMMERIESGTASGLSPKQRKWAESIKRQITGEPEDAANLYSGWSEKKQAEEQRRAAAVRLPWENPDGTRKPMPKPPGRK